MPEETVSVRSSAPTAIRLSDGVVVKGANDPDVRGRVAVTHNVPRSLFEAWKAKFGPKEAVAAHGDTPAREAVPAHELHDMLTAVETPAEVHFGGVESAAEEVHSGGTEHEGADHTSGVTSGGAELPEHVTSGGHEDHAGV